MFGRGEGQRYKGAIAVASWLRIFGVLTLIGTALGAISALTSSDGNGAGVFVTVVLGGGLAASFMFAASYGLDVLVDVANSLARIDEKGDRPVRR